MIRLGALVLATLVGFVVILSLMGGGEGLTRSPDTASTRASRDAGAAALADPQATTAPEPAGALRPDPVPAPAGVSTTGPVVAAERQTPLRQQVFPGPPLQPSPEYAGRTPPVALPDNADGPVLYVTADRLNMRAGPSTNDRVLGALTRGAAVTAVDADPGADADGWRQIRDGDGRMGYVSARFLSDSRP